MKCALPIFFSLILIVIGCDDNPSTTCIEFEFEENEIKKYFPYNEGATILFRKDSINNDSLIISSFSVYKANKIGMHACSRPGEAVLIRTSINYNNGKQCEIEFESPYRYGAPDFIASGCNFNAVLASYKNGNGVVNKVEDYMYNGHLFNDVLRIIIDDMNVDIQEIVLVKDDEFLFIKIDDTIREVIR